MSTRTTSRASALLAVAAALALPRRALAALHAVDRFRYGLDDEIVPPPLSP